MQHFQMVVDSFEVSRRTYENARANLVKHRETYAKILATLEARNLLLTNATVDTDDLNIHFTGNKDVLAKVWHVLRRMGFEPLSRPGPGVAAFYGRFERKDDECKVYIYFTSTMCRLVKVGTETVTHDVYETICE